MLKNIEISSSKSLFNRALIIQSYFPTLRILNHTNSEDVKHLKNSLDLLKAARVDQENAKELYVGEGGTTFRFLALRVSRIPGRWILRGKKTLFNRPNASLINLFQQLGVESQWGSDFLKIQTQGWRLPKTDIEINTKESSQFASAFLLNSFGFDQSLNFNAEKNMNSESYFEMTLNLVRDLGLKVIETEGKGPRRKFAIPEKQKPTVEEIKVESDMSSIFTIASFAALNQEILIENFPFDSQQPDFYFLKIFSQMNIPYEKIENKLLIKKTNALKSIEVDLKDTPDLFPVLSCLCTQAEGVSRLYGAAHLKYKESNRLFKTKELLDFCGVVSKINEDGIEIHGDKQIKHKNEIVFNPASDHRMAFAAALMKSIGYDIKILHPEVVNKSFSEFWQYSGVRP